MVLPRVVCWRVQLRVSLCRSLRRKVGLSSYRGCAMCWYRRTFPSTEIPRSASAHAYCACPWLASLATPIRFDGCESRPAALFLRDLRVRQHEQGGGAVACLSVHVDPPNADAGDGDWRPVARTRPQWSGIDRRRPRVARRHATGGGSGRYHHLRSEEAGAGTERLRAHWLPYVRG